MESIRKKSILGAYTANVPIGMSVFGNFLAGAICRLISAVFLVQGIGAADICLCAAAMLTASAIINVTVYIMSGAFAAEHRRSSSAAATVIGAAVSFAAGAVSAPLIIGLASQV